MKPFDIKVNFYDRIYKQADPSYAESITLWEWIISDNWALLQNKIRAIADKEIRREQKARILPAITPSLIGAATHTGFIGIDVDGDDNPGLDMATLKDDMREVPEIAYVGKSVSGDGLWMLIQIPKSIDSHKTYFKAIRDYFTSIGVTIDAKCSNVNRLRFYAYDGDSYINAMARPWALPAGYGEQPCKEYHGPRLALNMTELDRRLSELICTIDEDPVDMTEDYRDWLRFAIALAGNYGEGGRAYFHEISKYHQNYDPQETDALFTQCLTREYCDVPVNFIFRTAQRYGYY